MEYEAEHDSGTRRYNVDLGSGHVAWVSYSHHSEGVITLDYSEVPAALRGHGMGSIMMESVLTRIAAEKLQVVPVCGYTRHYIDQHEQWSHLLYTG